MRILRVILPGETSIPLFQTRKRGNTATHASGVQLAGGKRARMKYIRLGLIYIKGSACSSSPNFWARFHAMICTALTIAPEKKSL